MKIKFYSHTVWGDHIKQLALIPTVFVTSNSYRKSKFLVVSLSFLMWDFGISFYKEV